MESASEANFTAECKIKVAPFSKIVANQSFGNKFLSFRPKTDDKCSSGFFWFDQFNQIELLSVKQALEMKTMKL